jgi:hypothetical protein
MMCHSPLGRSYKTCDNKNRCLEIKVNSNPGGQLFRTWPDGIKFIMTSIFEERGCKEWAYMCRFHFCEMIWPFYFLLMVHSMNVKNRLLTLRKFKDLNFVY